MSATPKQTAAGPRADRLPPQPGAVVNVGDLVARLNGCACPPAAWPRTHDKAADRRAFAAALAGVSETHFDPKRPGTPGQQITVAVGGAWTFSVEGAVKKGEPVGPAVREDGSIDPQRLAKCEPDEAIGEAAADAAGGSVAVTLKS